LTKARDADYPTLRRTGTPSKSHQISGRFRTRPPFLAHCLPGNYVEKWLGRPAGAECNSGSRRSTLDPDGSTDTPSRLKPIVRSILDGYLLSPADLCICISRRTRSPACTLLEEVVKSALACTTVMLVCACAMCREVAVPAMRRVLNRLSTVAEP
jgi:hypothetical protein